MTFASLNCIQCHIKCFSLSMSSLCRHPTVRDKDRDSRKPRADVRSGVHGRSDQAGLLLLSLRLQAEARELWERAVAAHQLHLPAGLWRYRQRFPHLRLTVVSVQLPVCLSDWLSVFLSVSWAWTLDCSRGGPCRVSVDQLIHHTMQNFIFMW